MGKCVVVPMLSDDKSVLHSSYVGDGVDIFELSAYGHGLAHNHYIEIGFRPNVVMIRRARRGEYDAELSTNYDTGGPMEFVLTEAGFFMRSFVYGYGYPVFQIGGITDTGFFVGSCRKYQSGYKNAATYANDKSVAYEFIAMR